jgi:predicted RNA-binding Zn ribbon-like protein
MADVPAPLSLGADLPLKYVGGDPSVDLVNTVDYTARGLEHERIPDYPRFIEWAESAGVVSRPIAERLLRTARLRPREATAAHAAATRLRWVLQRLFEAVATGSPAGPDQPLAEFNVMLADALGHLRLGRESARRGGISWTWDGWGDDLASPVWAVARAGAELLASDDRGRLRVCDAPDCGWMYVDRSRNGLRRWCQMETCGTRAKNRRRRR